MSREDFMFSKNIFSERIKQLRVGMNVTQNALAEHLGITRTQVSDIENGKTTTSIERLCVLSDYFGVSADYLLGLSENPEVNK